MKRVALAALCLTACGAEPPIPSRNEAASGSGKLIEAPIAPPSPAPAAPDATIPSPSKPLVSRETSQPHRPAPDYRAIGTEPFWAIAIRGDTLTLQRPDQPGRRYRVAHEDDGRALRYVGDGLTTTVTEGPCSDGMSDSIWSDRVQVAFAEGTLKGCGGERDDPDADAAP